MAHSVCGKKQYETWNSPCGMPIIAGESGVKQNILAIEIKDKIDHIISKLNEAKQMVKNLKRHYSIYRIQNTESVQFIEEFPDFIYAYGAKDMNTERDKALNSNASISDSTCTFGKRIYSTYIVLEDYDSMASAVMFTERILFNEYSSEFYGQLNKVLEYQLLTGKLANILCDFVIILAKSGIMPSTYLTCKNTVPGSIQSRDNDNEWIFIEYWILRDIKLYLEVMIPKYQLTRSLLR